MGKNTAIIVQARLSSTRLPRKVLLEVDGRALLSYQLERLKRVSQVQYLIAAIPEGDQELIDFCQKEGVNTYSGSEEDVLSRYYEAAKEVQAEVVVRITGDCPLIDPAVIEKGLNLIFDCDYASNCLERTYPRGMDVEVMTFQALERAVKEADQPYEREHVTPYLIEHPSLFKLKNYTYSKDLSSLRLTVDTQEDFSLVKAVIEKLYPLDPDFSLEDILTLFEKEPELVKINRHVEQKRMK